MIYYLFWVDLLSISVLVSVAVFLLLLKSGQLSDQSRARFLPLAGERFTPGTIPPVRSRAQTFALLSILILGLMILLSPFLVLFLIR